MDSTKLKKTPERECETWTVQEKKNAKARGRGT
jgi:hypothetical protein